MPIIQFEKLINSRNVHCLNEWVMLIFRNRGVRMKWYHYIILSLASMVVLLDQPLVGDADNPTGDTKVDLNLAPNTSSVPVVDKDLPSNSTTNYPAGAEIRNGAGLSLAYVTKGLDFGTQTLDLFKMQSYSPNVKSDFLWGGQFVIEIADGRGTHAGWTLAVSGNSFERVDKPEATNSVPSTLYPTISLQNARIYSSFDDAVSINRNSVEVELQNGSNSMPLVQAPRDHGMGMTVVQIDPHDIKLNIPVNSVQAGEYRTSLNWILQNVP